MKLSEIKNWSIEVEKEIAESWKKSPLAFNPKSKKKIYSIDTPPPYVNTPIHMGHAVTYTYMDFFARYRRMKGFEVLFPLGIDRNGLPIEMAAEKKFEVSPFHIGRDAFIKLCKRVLEETTAASIDSFARLGISFNSYKKDKEIGSMYETDSEEYRTITQATFIDLYRRKLIYEDTRINNWDPKLRTTIADSEIDYKELPSTFNHIKFKVKETGETIIIATTRPELIPACGMIIFNPEDSRYEKLEGKTAILPLFGGEVPIGEHPFAQQDKGSGLVMMCSAGDITDIQFFREMNLPTRICINRDGTMNERAGFLKGLSVKEARKAVIEELRKENLLLKQEQITHRTPIAERSGAEVEFIEMPELYLKQLEIKDDLKEIINKIDFYSPESRKILENWIDSVSIDWPISRRRFYGTPIPLWYSEDLVALPEKGEYYEPWKQQVPKDAEVFRNGKLVGRVKDFKNKEWKGEERIFDTWFDSSISELVLLQYEKDPSFFKKAFPATLRPQGKEIVRTWLYYTILRGYLATKKPAFKEVWIHNHILDEKGKKMSKSLGNVIDPHAILDTEGAEALRLWCAIEGDIAKQDLLCSRERIKAELKTINKLLNLTRFVTQYPKPSKVKLTETDELFIEHVNHLIDFADKSFEEYDMHHPTIKIRQFVWDTFASHYVEMVKARAYNETKEFSKSEQDSAHFTLRFILEKISQILHPIIPQVTSIMAAELKVSLENFPKGKAGAKSEEIIHKITEFNSQIWKLKKEKGISLRESITGVTIPAELKKFKQDLIACHKIA